MRWVEINGLKGFDPDGSFLSITVDGSAKTRDREAVLLNRSCYNSN